MRRRVRLTESDLHRIVRESVKRVLMEGKYTNNKVPRGDMSYVDDDGNVVDIPDEPFYREYNSPDAKKKRNDRYWRNLNFQRLWLDAIWDDKGKALDWLKNNYEGLEREFKNSFAACQWLGEPEGTRISYNKDLELWELSEGGYAILVRKGKEKDWSE